jgi:hypothetical protein
MRCIHDARCQARCREDGWVQGTTEGRFRAAVYSRRAGWRRRGGRRPRDSLAGDGWRRHGTRRWEGRWRRPATQRRDGRRGRPPCSRRHGGSARVQGLPGWGGSVVVASVLQELWRFCGDLAAIRHGVGDRRVCDVWGRWVWEKSMFD